MSGTLKDIWWLTKKNLVFGQAVTKRLSDVSLYYSRKRNITIKNAFLFILIS